MKITKLLYSILSVSSLIFIASCDNNEGDPKKEPIVTTATPTNVTLNSATVGGTVTDDGNDDLLKTGVVYSSNVSVPTIADNKKETATATDGLFTLEITGLSSGTTYHVRAFATNSVGTSYGDVVDIATANAPPVVSNISITGILEVAKTVTAAYSYSDSENDSEGGTEFQWYVASSSTGSDETPIAGATEKTFTISEEQNGKFLRVTITPKASGGTSLGIPVNSAYTTAIGSETVTFVYNGATVTYGTITGSTGKKWLDRNLGAARAAQSLTDYQAYGDFFQWGRAADKHQLITRTSGASEDAVGVTGQTSSTVDETSPDATPETDKFIVVTVSFTRDWQNPQNENVWQGVDGVNNPCPIGWRLPTRTEWSSEFPEFTPETAFSKLKLTYTGQRLPDGTFSNAGEFGYFWTSTPHKSGNTYYTAFYAEGDASFYAPRATGYPCRCIKD